MSSGSIDTSSGGSLLLSGSAPDSVQLIGENKDFNDQLGEFLELTNTIKSGLNYHVVSVFGSQSTGKSTLLNALFGTRFKVMNERERSQTTKGIWMGKAIMSGEAEAISDNSSSSSEEGLIIGSGGGSSSSFSSPGYSSASPSESEDFLNVIPSSSHILVLDVEGTDGRERGEDQDFERRSALFALATSEVLIVNMWENQVGLYQGANMGLLKTVFEVNLSLFQGASGHKTSRSLILFVIRDHLGTTPLENLSQTILQDLKKHWDSISKPSEALKESKIQDFFDIQFFTLPHKVLLPGKFLDDVSKLSRRFTNPNSSSYVFQPEYHRHVPIDGWGMYAKQIWEQIELNKDLDLPTQQMLVARFRCEEISAQAWDYFEEELNKLDQSIGGKLGSSEVVTASFGSSLKKLRVEALAQYDSTASRYQKMVYLSKRKDLLSRIDSRILTLYRGQLQALHKACLAIFHSNLASTANREGNFAKAINDAKRSAQKLFEAGAQEATVDDTVFSYQDQQQLFHAELLEVENQKKDQEIKKIVIRTNKRVARIFSEELDSLFSNPDDDTWRKVLDFFNATLRTVLGPYEGGNDFKVGASSEANRQGSNDIRKAAWVSLDSRLRDITREDNVVMRLREVFEKSFRYDKNEVPIIWKPTDDIEGPYVKARDNALSLLPIFAIAILPDGQKLEPDVIIDEDTGIEDDFAIRISEHRQQEISSKFRRQADAIYIESKRSTSQTATHIPFYVIVLIVVLGWNEFMAVLRNPCKFNTISSLALTGSLMADMPLLV